MKSDKLVSHEADAATSIRQPSRRGGWGEEGSPPVGSSTSAMPNVRRNTINSEGRNDGEIPVL